MNDRARPDYEGFEELEVEEKPIWWRPRDSKGRFLKADDPRAPQPVIINAGGMPPVFREESNLLDRAEEQLHNVDKETIRAEAHKREPIEPGEPTAMTRDFGGRRWPEQSISEVGHEYRPAVSKPLPKSISFRCGQIDTEVFGGPFRSKPEDMIGVCMAAEIKQPFAVIRVPTRDFSVPDEDAFKNGLIAAIALMNIGHVIYAGCMGGSGRTGMFLAALKKIEIEAKYSSWEFWKERQPDCIEEVRREYKRSAVETKQQEEWIRKLWVRDIAIWARGLK